MHTKKNTEQHCLSLPSPSPPQLSHTYTCTHAQVFCILYFDTHSTVTCEVDWALNMENLLNLYISFILLILGIFVLASAVPLPWWDDAKISQGIDFEIANTGQRLRKWRVPYMRLLFTDQFQRVCFAPVRCSVCDDPASSREPFCLCRFVKDGSTFVQALSLGSIQFCGFVRSAKLPPLSPNLKNPKPRVEVNMLTNETEEAPVSLAAGVQLLCGGFRGDVCSCVALSAVALNSSCDFDAFVHILCECFSSAQRSYT